MKIKFLDGYYEVMPDGVGDTICGSQAHDAMFCMDRHFKYVNQPYEEKIKFLNGYKKEMNQDLTHQLSGKGIIALNEIKRTTMTTFPALIITESGEVKYQPEYPEPAIKGIPNYPATYSQERRETALKAYKHACESALATAIPVKNKKYAEHYLTSLIPHKERYLSGIKPGVYPYNGEVKKLLILNCTHMNGSGCQYNCPVIPLSHGSMDCKFKDNKSEHWAILVEKPNTSSYSSSSNDSEPKPVVNKLGRTIPSMNEMDYYNRIKQLESANKELVEALSLALPYVQGAYECAFPDQSENDYVKEKIQELIL